MLFSYRAEAVKLALPAVIPTVLVAECRELGIHSVARDSVGRRDPGEDPARVREVVGVAGALVFVVHHGPKRPLHRPQQVRLARPIAGHDEAAIVAADQLIGIAVAISVADDRLHPRQAASVINAWIDDDVATDET